MVGAAVLAGDFGTLVRRYACSFLPDANTKPRNRGLGRPGLRGHTHIHTRVGLSADPRYL